MTDKEKLQALDDYVSKTDNRKPIRDFVSLENYQIDEDGELYEKNGEPCDWTEILEIFEAYRVVRCMCPEQLAEALLDRFPTIFNEVDLDLR